MTSTPIPDDHKFPDCLSFDLSVKSRKIRNISNLFGMFSSEKNHKLYLSINFGEQRDYPIEIPEILERLGIKVKASFALRGGTLRLQLKNAEIPLENLQLFSEFKLRYEIERQNESGRENEGSFSFSVPRILNFFKENTLGIVTKNRQSYKAYTKIKDTFNSVTNGGTDQERTWIFQTPSNQFILEGLLQRQMIAILKVINKSISITATFEVRDEDIELLPSGRRNIGANKEAWIKRVIFLSYIKPKLQPYLSKVEVSYEN